MQAVPPVAATRSRSSKHDGYLKSGTHAIECWQARGALFAFAKAARPTRVELLLAHARMAQRQESIIPILPDLSTQILATYPLRCSTR